MSLAKKHKHMHTPPQEGSEEDTEEYFQIKIDLPKKYKKYFEYLQLYFGINLHDYINQVITSEIESRLFDLSHVTH
jgi:hypothetical protein